jgi:Tfp pilus assembly protein PilE
MCTQKGFGYIGLLISIVIVALLFGVAITTYYRNSARVLYTPGGVDSVLDEAEHIIDLSDERHRLLQEQLPD